MLFTDIMINKLIIDILFPNSESSGPLLNRKFYAIQRKVKGPRLPFEEK